LKAALTAAGAAVETVPGLAGQPDMVFPANAAVVLDGRAIVARFACAERRGEETGYMEALQAYVARGILDEVAIFPEGCFQEGAGDAIWDIGRQFFWAGYGQRSILAATTHLERFFGKPVVALELASNRFYHLDTCFCPLSPRHSPPKRLAGFIRGFRRSSAWKPRPRMPPLFASMPSMSAATWSWRARPIMCVACWRSAGTR
jgi:N-dimethylarginine dimethylaminohydrolase